MQPYHADLDIKKDVTFSFKRKTFTEQMKSAWRCECDLVCKGAQFYQSQSPLQMKWYSERHNNQLPHEVIGVSRVSTNATICSKCATDAKTRELSVGRTFSSRNGFGPIIKYEINPESIVSHHQNVQIALRLQQLMESLTLVEESASR